MLTSYISKTNQLYQIYTFSAEMLMQMVVNFKNGGYMPSSLGGRSIVVVRQADKSCGLQNFLKFDNFNFKARLSC